jgi:hypothetical protein
MPAAGHEGKAAAPETCPGCCSCPVLAVQASGTVDGVWEKSGRVMPATDRAHPSAVLEALAEPPRSFV